MIILLIHNEQLIKFVVILKPDVCIISGRLTICIVSAPQRSTNMVSP